MSGSKAGGSAASLRALQALPLFQQRGTRWASAATHGQRRRPLEVGLLCSASLSRWHSLFALFFSWVQWPAPLGQCSRPQRWRLAQLCRQELCSGLRSPPALCLPLQQVAWQRRVERAVAAAPMKPGRKASSSQLCSPCTEPAWPAQAAKAA